MGIPVCINTIIILQPMAEVDKEGHFEETHDYERDDEKHSDQETDENEV